MLMVCGKNSLQVTVDYLNTEKDFYWPKRFSNFEAKK